MVISSALGGDKDLQLENILTALETRYNGKSFTAEFIQLTSLDALDLMDESSGRAWFSHPGKMKWQYLLPSHHEFITNGKTLWFFQPEENQVTVSSAANFFKAGSGGSFLSDFAQVRKNYAARIKKTSGVKTILELVPKKMSMDIASIDVTVSQKTHNILEVSTYNPLGDTTKISFTNIQFKPLDPALFEFAPPNKATIIQMDEP